MDFTKIDRLIEESLPQMAADMMQLCSFPSVEGESAGAGAPFGKPVADCLAAAMRLTGGMGLDSHNLEGYCGYADLVGETGELVGVLGHLDVVPAVAADWKHPPFSPENVDGRIYGRGTMDDKGPMVAALYGAKALREAGVKLSKTVRFIFGCNEETGMECMKYYLAHCPAPTCGFTPDAGYPLIIGEKGIMHYTLRQTWARAEGGKRLVNITAGTAANVVPAKAEATLLGFDALTSERSDIVIVHEGDKTVVTALGAAAHASTPDEGENALSKLLRYLSALDFAPAGAKAYVNALAKLTEDDLYGESLGIAGEDELSRTTNAPTVCALDETGGVLTCDLRFKLSDHSDFYLAALEKAAKENGLVFEAGMYQEPLWLGRDNPLAAKLLESYREVTGDMTEPLILGGGTYAKVVPGFLAFGPEPYGEPTRAHQADEFLSEDELLQAAKIYARAIYRMAE